MWDLPTIDPYVFPSNYDTLYNDSDGPLDSVSPIRFSFPAWSLARAGTSRTSTAGTPSLVSSSELDCLTPPTMLNASPRTPARAFSPVTDSYDTDFLSIPVFSHPSPHPMSNTVRILSFILPSLFLNSFHH